MSVSLRVSRARRRGRPLRPRPLLASAFPLATPHWLKIADGLLTLLDPLLELGSYLDDRLRVIRRLVRAYCFAAYVASRAGAPPSKSGAPVRD